MTQKPCHTHTPQRGPRLTRTVREKDRGQTAGPERAGGHGGESPDQCIPRARATWPAQALALPPSSERNGRRPAEQARRRRSHGLRHQKRTEGGRGARDFWEPVRQGGVGGAFLHRRETGTHATPPGSCTRFLG